MQGDESDGEDEGRKKYLLEVLAEEKDEMGKWVLMGKHAAYGDEQVCQLMVTQTDEGHLQLSYADGETHCTGTLDLSSKSITGNVQQLSMGEEGFFVPNAKVTHTFKLTLKDEAPSARHLRSGLKAAHLRRIRALPVMLSTSQVVKAKIEAELSMLQALQPKELLDDAMEFVEGMCAKMRRQAKMLQELKFTTAEDRSDTLARLADRGIALDKAHAAADEAFLAIRSVLAFQERVGKRELHHSDLINFLPKAQIRLEMSYMRLDRALKSAQRRLPKDVIDSWKSKHPGASWGDAGAKADDDSSDTCMICLLEIETSAADAAAQGLFLPCGHKFHEDCVRSWLHSHVTCPICRAQLDPPPSSGREAKSASQDADKAVAKIQALVRGYQVRQRQREGVPKEAVGVVEAKAGAPDEERGVVNGEETSSSAEEGRAEGKS